MSWVARDAHEGLGYVLLEVKVVGSKGKRKFRAPANPMMRQIEQLQTQMLQAQEDLGEETVTATAGGGAVTVVMNGHQDLQSITIVPEVVDPDDIEMLQDLIVAAINGAVEMVRELSAKRMGPLAGGLDIPGLM